MKAIDLFAGLGGLSTGAEMAGCQTIWAGNHWRPACDIYARNHGITPACQDLQQQDWTAVPPHDIQLAAPACQGHSRARGKDKPHHDALRNTAWAVVEAAECHRPPVVLVENVPEFEDWALYPSWLHALQALGYAVARHTIDAADHGVPQHRKRLFVVATRSKHPIQLALPKRAHVAVRTVIDFDAGQWKPLHAKVPNTRARAARGRQAWGERFVMPYYKSGSGLTGRDINRPIGTIPTKARWAVVRGDHMRMLTVDELRMCMGFPAGYELPANVALATHMLGNAVCPPVARDVIEAIRAAI